ncbi:MAG: DUF4810 domain-containing protein [Rhodoferax sp.]|nr:DUF4810 domain-containing protein [Rhodoferax sp.]
METQPLNAGTFTSNLVCRLSFFTKLISAFLYETNQAMKYTMNILARLTLFSTIVFILAGCATKKTTLYEWKSYQNNLDAYFRADKVGLPEQTASLESDLTEIKKSDSSAPPGYVAHLGLVYGQQGYVDKFVENLSIEKTNFPESTPFIDFLLRNFKKGDKRETN